MEKYSFKGLTKRYFYVNSDITEKNFPWPKTIRTEGYKIINMGRSYSSLEALDRMKSENCRPATIHELAVIAHEHPELFPDGTWSSLVAFGTDFIDSVGRHGVPLVDRHSDGGRGFGLGLFSEAWGGGFCLLCFCDKQPSDTQTTKNDIDALTLAIQTVKDAGYKVIREF